VAREIVTDTYQSNASATEFLEDIKDKLMHLDQVYLDAAKKVTPDQEEEIKGKLEYRILHFGTQQLTHAKDTAQKGLGKVSEARQSVSEGVSQRKKQLTEKIGEKKNEIKAVLISCKDKFTNTFEVKLRSAQTNVAGFRSKSVILVRQASAEVRLRAASAGKALSEKIHKTAEALQLREFLDSVQERFIALGQFSLREIAQLKKHFQRLYDYLVEKIDELDLIGAVKRGGKRAVENFQSALHFLKETCVQNARALQKMASDTSGFATNFSRKNRQLLSFMRAENKKLVNNYAKKLEMEVYYSPQDSVKVLGKVRGLLGWLFPKNGETHAKEIFVADDHQKSE
jgi:hypothetical protein